MTEGMRNFAEQYGIAINDPDLEAIYNMYWESVTDEASRLAFATEEGEKRGIKLGEERGIKLGEERGDRRRAIQDARAMKKEGIEVGVISRVTGLSLEEIDKL